ncbi:hypothetical protein [Comamonas kerstersii]|uniref:hypothetical protein n=1 Tax=Comamonas kerstersii TaxID=225992 RepID=UPI001B34333F|nr:hypothetical protein [Comamonas kerstersii]QTW17571.1 hypothetical protein H8N02_09835 [Comamonas kerstersii]
MADQWQAADKAYQQHHASCGTCKGAGLRPNEAQRCPEGQALWTNYLNTPLPLFLTKKWPQTSTFKKKK